MTTVEFVEIPERRWWAGVCTAIEAQQRAGRRIYAWTDSEAAARELDELLWTFRDESFVPHGLWQGQAQADDPVVVGWAPGNPNDADLLVLLCDPDPADLLSYPQVLDFVPKAHPERVAAARTRFRAFREAGLDVRFRRPEA